MRKQEDSRKQDDILRKELKKQEELVKREEERARLEEEKENDVDKKVNDKRKKVDQERLNAEVPKKKKIYELDEQKLPPDDEKPQEVEPAKPKKDSPKKSVSILFYYFNMGSSKKRLKT